MPAPEGNRSVLLDGLPTELLDSIEVSKSLTPDQDADSIGGRIDFKTKKATDLDDTLLTLKFDTQYNEQAKNSCLLYTSPSPRDLSTSRMPSSA